MQAARARASARQVAKVRILTSKRGNGGTLRAWVPATPLLERARHPVKQLGVSAASRLRPRARSNRFRSGGADLIHLTTDYGLQQGLETALCTFSHCAADDQGSGSAPVRHVGAAYGGGAGAPQSADGNMSGHRPGCRTACFPIPQ